MAEPAKNFEPESVRKLQTKAKLRLVDSKSGENNSPVIDPSPARAKLFLVKNEVNAEVDTANSSTASTNQTPKLTLVKPAQDDEVYETSGTEASNPKGESLDKKSGAGQGHTDSEALSDAEKSASSSTTDAASRPELAKLGSTTAGEDSGSLYKRGEGSSKTKGRPKSLKGWAFKHQKKLFGGGIITFIVGLFMMLTFASGPLQFMHFSQLLQQFHLGQLQDTQDSRFAKQIRFWRDVSKGQVEKSRLSIVGRKVAPKFETKLNASGFKSSYSSSFGYFNGYEIDRSNPQFKGKTQSEIRKIVKDQYGLDVVGPEKLGLAYREASSGKLFIDASNLGFLDTHRLNYAVLRESGYSKLSAAIGSRTLCNQAGCTLHPLKKLTASLAKDVEAKFYAKERAKQIAKASASAKLKASGTQDSKDPTNTQTTASQANDTNNSIADAAKSGADLKNGDTGALESQKLKFSSILKGGGLSLAVGGLACMLQGINDSVLNSKNVLVEVPAMNTGYDIVGTDQQLRAGQDVNTSQLSYNAKFLNGTDSTGNKSSWLDAETFQTMLGHPGKGVPADKTLATIGTNQVPFPEVQTSTVRTFCHVLASPFVTAITFIGSGLTSIALSFAQSFVAGQVADRAAHWLSSTPIDPFAVGADLGNIANYGMHLASAWQFAAAGGVPLSSAVAQQQAVDNQVAIKDDISRKGLLYKIFNPKDANSTIAKVIDQQNPDPIKNVARMASSIFNVKGIFGSIGNIFSSKAKADSPTTYDYGLPSYGFTDQELYGPIGNESPYDNAGKVAILLESANGPDYISKAQKCFGATIEQISTTADDGSVSQAWGVDSAKNTLVNVDNGSTKDCASDTNQDNWLRIRLFILDSVTMDNMACYQGDSESCNNIGVSTTDNTSGTTPGGSTPTGDGTGGCSLSAPAYGTQNGTGNNYTEQQLRTIFGDPGTATSHAAMDANLTNVDFLGYNAQVHKLAAPCLRAVTQDIQASGTTYKIREFGCYRYDSNNGTSNIGTKSYHTYGVACDINWSTNPFIDNTNLSTPCNPDPSKYDIPQEIITAFHNHGWTWGGNWCSVKDYMHFEFNGIAP